MKDKVLREALIRNRLVSRKELDDDSLLIIMPDFFPTLSEETRKTSAVLNALLKHLGLEYKEGEPEIVKKSKGKSG